MFIDRGWLYEESQLRYSFNCGGWYNIDLRDSPHEACFENENSFCYFIPWHECKNCDVVLESEGLCQWCGRW